MINLNYNNLNADTQEMLLLKSKKDVERYYGKALKRYAAQKNMDYENLLEEEAIRNLYNYRFSFSI